MGSLIDNLRSGAASQHRCRVATCDPGSTYCGLAWADLTVRMPAAVVEVSTVHSWFVSMGDSKKKPWEQTSEFVTFLRSLAKVEAVTLAVVEGQQTYGRPSDSVAKVVAQANDLHRLACAAGAAAGWLAADETRVVLPAEWKGQAKKEATWRQAHAWLSDRGVRCFQHTRVRQSAGLAMQMQDTDLLVADSLPRGFPEHVLDAISMIPYASRLLLAGLSQGLAPPKPQGKVTT